MPYMMVTLHNFFYLQSALELTRLAKHTEDAGQKEACVFGAITASVAFLECSVNGLYEHSAGQLGRMTKYRRLLASVFHEKMKFENLPWLTKYQVALALAHKPTFDLGAEPYQSAELLNALRNELIHPKRIFLDSGNPFGDEPLEKSRLEKRLVGRFVFNPKRQGDEGEVVGDEFIPKRCLSVGCAAWALATAVKFYSEFESCIPVTAYFFGVAGSADTYLTELRKLKIP